MNTINLCICLILVLIQYSHAMRCRSGNDQTIEDVGKVMLKCKRSNSESGKNDSDSSTMNESSEDDSSSSDSGLFNQDFFSHAKKDVQNMTRNSDNRSLSRGNGADLYRQQSSHPSSHMNPPNYMNMGENQFQRSNNSYDNGFIMSGMQQDNQGTTNEDSREKSCIAQCFFDELNSVNQRGFPERIPVTRMLLRGIQDPVVRDFIEESIHECFQFLSSEANGHKCTFSQNLLNCFADKGREHCEDWND